ncbi:SNARE associated Golgi protein [Balamuthia mandrillaris]
MIKWCPCLRWDCSTWVRLFLISFFTAGGVGLFTWLTYSGRLEIFLTWVESIGIWGHLIFVVSFCVTGLPFAIFGYTPLALAAGYLYGPYAIITVSVGTLLGSVVGFWTCRTVMYSWFHRKIKNSPTLTAFLTVMESHGFKLILIMRMSPISFGVQNGLFSLSSISGFSFLLATVIGVFPEILMLVYMGSTMRDLASIATGDYKFGTMQKVMLAVEITLSVTLCIALFFFSRKAMRQVRAQQRKDALRKAAHGDEDDVEWAALAGSDEDEPTFHSHPNRKSEVKPLLSARDLLMTEEDVEMDRGVSGGGVWIPQRQKPVRRTGSLSSSPESGAMTELETV